jgi:hypothetical protein
MKDDDDDATTTRDATTTTTATSDFAVSATPPPPLRKFREAVVKVLSTITAANARPLRSKFGTTATCESKNERRRKVFRVRDGVEDVRVGRFRVEAHVFDVERV